MNSNLILRILKSLAAALLICLASFFVLLVLAFSIPASLLRGNAASSAETLLAEGDNPYIFGGRQDWSLDNYTASIMLNTAAADVKNPVIALAEDYSWNKKGTTARVEHFADSIGGKVEEQRGGEWIGYWRYWHGYVTALRPLLLVTDLNGIRTLFLLAFSALLLVTSWLFSRMSNPVVGLLYGVSFCFVSWFVSIVSIPFAFSFLIGIVAVLFVQLHQSGRWSFDGEPADYLPRWGAFFLVIGALTVFFDFLDNPIITLGLPASTLLFLNRGRVTKASVGKCVGLILLACLCWGVGYIVTWVVKWVIVSLVTGENMVSAAMGEVRYRSGTVAWPTEGGTGFTRAAAASRNLHVLLPHAKRGVAIIVCAALVIAILMRASRTRVRTCWLAPNAIVFLLPYFWYLAVSNHSYIHYWFTFRDQLVSIVAAALVLGDCVWELCKTIPARREGASRQPTDPAD